METVICLVLSSVGNGSRVVYSDIIPPAHKWRASRVVPSGLAARLVLKGRELSARDLSAGAAGAMTRGELPAKSAIHTPIQQHRNGLKPIVLEVLER
jgi:hypothetical protein